MTDPAHQPAAAPFPGKAWLLLAWRRKWWLVLGAVVGLSAGAAVYVQKPRVYESSVAVLVDRRPVPPTISYQPEAARVELEDPETHAALILSPEIADRAAKILAAMLGPNELAAAAVGGAAEVAAARGSAPGPYAVSAGAILNGLTIGKDSNGSTRVFVLNYRSQSQEEDPLVLNAVVHGYQEFLTERSTGTSAETLRLLYEARNALDKELVRKKKAYDDFREKKENQIVWSSKDANGRNQDRVNAIQTERNRLLSRQVEIEDRLRMAKTSLAAGTPRAAVVAAIERAEQVKAVNPAETNRQSRDDQILALKLDEQKLIDFGFGPGYEGLRDVRNRIEMIERSLAKSNAPGQAAGTPAGGDALAVLLDRLQQELDDIKTRHETWDRILDKEKAELAKLLALEAAHENYKKDIEDTQLLFDATVKRLTELDLLGSAGGLSARIISPPGPGRKVAPNLPQSLALGLMMGLVAGAGLALLSDLLDQSFRGPADVRSRLGLPVLGHLPPLRPRAADGPVDPTVVAYHAPGSAEAEAVRRLRAALKLRSAGDGPKVLQVTSPDAGAGKSVLAANLAVSLTQSGKRVLLVEADHRRPGQHALFGVDAGTGFAAALAGVAGPDDVVRPTAVPNLAVVPWGDPTGDPADLLTSPRFEQLLAAWGGTYPLILIDSPPTLAAHDAGEVALRANGVLLVVPATAAARPPAVRAVATLRAAGANLLGVVVNLGARGARTGRYELDRYDRGMPVNPAAGIRAVAVPSVRPEDVRDGLLNGEFFLEYLPTVRLDDGRCVGVEALARWRRPGRVVPPAEFIPRIRNTPVAGLLTRWVVETVAAELGPWLRDVPGVHLSVNVPLDVLNQGEVEAVGRKAGLADLTDKFVVEVTERGTPGRLAADARLAVSARPGAARIALDDVNLDGVDLLSLTRLGVDIVKLDKSVADLLAVEGAAGGVMRQLAAAVRAAAFQVVAEGVETAAQADLFRAAGVTLAQGWLFSKPLRAGKFLEYYATRPGGADDEPLLLTLRPASDDDAVPLTDPANDSGHVNFDEQPVPLTAIAGKPNPGGHG